MVRWAPEPLCKLVVHRRGHHGPVLLDHATDSAALLHWCRRHLRQPLLAALARHRKFFGSSSASSSSLRFLASASSRFLSACCAGVKSGTTDTFCQPGFSESLRAASTNVDCMLSLRNPTRSGRGLSVAALGLGPSRFEKRTSGTSSPTSSSAMRLCSLTRSAAMRSLASFIWNEASSRP